MPVERVCLSAISEHRRASKPIMEKRRRARINCSLQELKSLILDATRKDASRHSKLEKADILEMTVKHLQAVQRQQMAAAVSTDPTVLHKFKSGFSECATEIARYLNSIDVEKGARQRIVQHVGTCLTGLNNYLSPLAFPAIPSGYPPTFFPNSQVMAKETLRAVPGGMMLNRAHPHIPQHFFPPSGLPMDYDSSGSCRSPSSPHSINSSYGPSTPTTPNSPASVCSKMSDSDPLWRPW